MKSKAPLILSFLLCAILNAQQHISEFTSLEKGAQDSHFYLPPSHRFQVLLDEDEFLASEGIIQAFWSTINFDFAGYVPIQSSSKSGYLSVNSETAPGGVVVLDIEFDDSIGKWQVDRSKSVDFIINPLFESQTFATISNCSGTVTPWGTVITCEETTSIETEAYCQIEANQSKLRCQYFSQRDNNGDGYDDFGWAIEIDPVTKTIVNQPGGRDDKDKLWAMGNFKHENAVVHSNSRTVYQGADATNGDGYLFKFVADEAENLSSGKLYVYRTITAGTGEWVLLKNSTQTEQNSTIAQCKAVNATSFLGIEDVEISPIDGMVYFAVKRDGAVYRFQDNDPISGTTVSGFETFVGDKLTEYPISDTSSETWGEGNDNLVFDDLGNLWVAQDGDNNYIWVVENGHTQANPKVKIFARTPGRSEPTGLTFSPDYRYIFMSIQHPRDNNSSQTDAFGSAVNFNSDVVLVLARNEHLNNNLTTADQDIMISQYYHDEATNSKWIEVKNISGKVIPAGSYFLDLYDSAALEDIAATEPKASQAIPAMEDGQVLLFKNSESPASPQVEYLGDADQIMSAVSDFDGDDVILITTTPGSRKYINRKDILGNTPASAWGQNTSLIRGGNSNELPQRDFDPSGWIELDSLEEVNQAVKTRNIALGTQKKGPSLWDGSKWINLEPDRTRNTIIDGTYNAGQTNIQVHDLSINSGASLNFMDNNEGSNKNLIIHGDLDVADDGSLSIGDTESLIIKNPAAEVTGKIEKIEISTPRNHANDITYWSSPVREEQIENVFFEVNPERIFEYDQSKYVDENTYWDVWVKAEGLMTPGKGFAAEGPSGETGNHELSFKGTPNFGIIATEAMYFDNDDGNNENADNDFNLIGNPYPAAIDIEAFLNTNGESLGVIDGTVYLWTHATAISDNKYSPSDYVTYNYTGGVAIEEDTKVSQNIGSGQGFFVRALKAEPLIFDPSMILPGQNDQFFKSSNEKNPNEKDRLWLNVKGDEGSFKQILIGFSESSTDDFDPGYDAYYLDNRGSLSFYSLLDNKKLAIQGLGPFEPSFKIDLGIDLLNEELNLKVEIERAEGALQDSEVFLMDHELGLLHDLKQGAYHFNFNAAGSFTNRFSLVFNSTILSDEDLSFEEGLNVYMQEGRLIVDAVQEITEVRLYDILGRQVMSDQPKKNSFQLGIENIQAGSFFIIELQGKEGAITTKKMVKY